jgi:hypothetical protein
MQFREIVSISGLGGLYQLITTKSDGAIVRSIEDGVTKFVAARSHHVTALDGIEVFTTGENARLFDVFTTMKANVAKAGSFDIAKANNNEIKAHFTKLFPDFDQDRVYVSDMKKMIKWLSIVDGKGLLNPQEEAAAEAPAAVESPEEKPVKKAKAAKPKAEVEATETPAAEAPAKKPRATKKKAEDAAE